MNVTCSKFPCVISQEPKAVLLPVCSTQEYYKQGQPPRTSGSWEMTLLNFERVTFLAGNQLYEL